MLTKQDHDTFKTQAENIIKHLRNCNSGADIHTVANMRNIATLILELVVCDSAQPDVIKPVLDRLEARLVEYFKNKFRDF